MRILLYNSGARGIGQYVRSLKIAEFLVSSLPDSSCRILAGNSIVERSLPENTDVVALPQISKSLDGRYLLKTGDAHLPKSDAVSLGTHHDFIVVKQTDRYRISKNSPLEIVTAVYRVNHPG